MRPGMVQRNGSNLARDSSVLQILDVIATYLGHHLLVYQATLVEHNHAEHAQSVGRDSQVWKTGGAALRVTGKVRGESMVASVS